MNATAEVGASERTVRRDIAELQDAGFDIELNRRDNRSIACLVDDRNYSPVPITKRELFTLLAVAACSMSYAARRSSMTSTAYSPSSNNG